MTTRTPYYSWQMMRMELPGKVAGVMYMGGNASIGSPMDPSGSDIELRRRDGTELQARRESYPHHGRAGGLGARGRTRRSISESAHRAGSKDSTSADAGTIRSARTFIFGGMAPRGHRGLPFAGPRSGRGRLGARSSRLSQGSPPHTLFLPVVLHSTRTSVSRGNTSTQGRAAPVNPWCHADLAFLEYRRRAVG